MGKKIYYEPGEILNEETGSKYIREVLVPKGERRRAIVQCGRCKKQYEAIIEKVKQGRLCKECGREIVIFKNKTRGRSFVVGEVVNKESGTMFLAPIACNPKNKMAKEV